MHLILDLSCRTAPPRGGRGGALIVDFSDPRFSPVKTAGRIGGAQRSSVTLRIYYLGTLNPTKFV